MATGQAIVGQTGDSVTVRYATNFQDGILLCSGSDNETGASNYFANHFYVNASNQLACDLYTGANATPQTFLLVNNVSSLSIRYGVNSAGTGNNVDSYMTAAQVSNWGNVVSVQITIKFINPMAAANGLNSAAFQAAQASTISFTRTMALMNKAGI
jgi:hypothetical protein